MPKIIKGAFTDGGHQATITSFFSTTCKKSSRGVDLHTSKDDPSRPSDVKFAPLRKASIVRASGQSTKKDLDKNTRYNSEKDEDKDEAEDPGNQKMRHLYPQIQSQVEYYLSDANLAKDEFYRYLISGSPHGQGWIEVAHILTAPRIKAMKGIQAKDIVNALGSSSLVETKLDPTLRIHLIRRKNNQKLPKLSRRRIVKPTYHRKRRKYNNNYHHSDYGFDGGSHGFSGYDCDRLLECGVKPWEEDAGNVLAALYH